MNYTVKQTLLNDSSYNLEDHGFVILHSVFDEATLVEMRDLTDRIIVYGERNLEDPFRAFYARHRVDQGALYDLFQRHPEFQELARNSHILDAVEPVLGQDIFLYENSLVYKPRNKNNEVPWHQDFINRPDEPRKLIAWMAFDPVTKENGAMKLVPGSHKLGFLNWYTVPGETHHTRANIDDIDLLNTIYAELHPGDVLIFNQLLLHSSDRVDTSLSRRAYRVAYQGFDEICVPRGNPIVLKGGTPEALAQRFPKLKEEEQSPMKKPLVKRALHKIGRVLLSL